jgi:hypothetical protein
MKLSIIALALASTTVMAQTSVYDPLPNDRRYVLTREGAAAAQYEARNPPVVQPVLAPAQRSYALPERAAVPMVQAPAWFVRLPQDTADMIFAAGTATSTDEQMAYDKARMAAERKLVELANSRITTQTKSYRSDRGDVSIENYEQVTRKNASGELIGAQRVDSQMTFDGRTYRVYVLLRLPQGDANAVANSRATARIQRETDIRSQAAHRELERNDQQAAQQDRDAVEQLRQEVAPVSTVAPVVVPAAGASAPASTVPTAAGPVRLLDVDNAEYRQRRAEALQKPGAVIGHITVR